MNWLWPKKNLVEIETTIAIRLGRVLHWAALVFAGVLWFGEFIGVIFGFWSDTHFVIGVVILGGIVVFLIGRGLRYVLANE